MAFNTQSLILASTSNARIAMLKAASLSFEVMKPDIDEAALQADLNHLSPIEMAEYLAKTKALSISQLFNHGFVIGSDQTLEFEGQIKHKAGTSRRAISNLRSMSGKSHQLHSSVCVVKNSQVLFTHTDTATLHMRPFSEHFLSAYAQQAPEALLHAVGGYYYEGLGIHLFENVKGDIHTILGLPLLPLLAFLRAKAIVSS